MAKALLLLLAFYCALLPVQGATIRVPTDQATIQAAVNFAVAGDTVRVAPGVYLEFVVLTGRPITLIGEGNYEAVIESPANKAALTANHAETAASVVTGFTIRNGVMGANIVSSSPTLTNNIFTNCATGLSLDNSSGLFINNRIVRSSVNGVWVVNGGKPSVQGNLIELGSNGIVADKGEPTFLNNIIRKNAAAGVNFTGQCDAVFIQNLVWGNGDIGLAWNITSAPKGPRVYQNTIVGNTASTKAALSAGGFDTGVVVANNIIMGTPAVEVTSVGDVTPPNLTNNLFFAPSGPAFTGNGQTLANTAGNRVADPRFSSIENAYFTVDSISPAIDRANAAYVSTTTDLAGRPRVQDGDQDAIARADLGAYEFEYQPGPARPPANSFSANVFLDHIDFTWAAIDNATNYIVKRAASAAGPFTELVVTNGLSARDANVVSNTVYYYTIAAENALGRGIDSPPLAVRAGIQIGVNDEHTLRVPEQFSTIQAAVDAAVAGDTVTVAPGLYREFVVLKGKAITLRSRTLNFDAVIEGPADKAVISAVNGESALTILTGLTIRGGSIGMNVQNSSPTFFGNIVTNCALGLSIDGSNGTYASNIVTSCSTAGMGINRLTPKVQRNVIEYCGKGIGHTAGDANIRENIIRHNDGIGIDMANQSDALIWQNVIYDNGGIGVAWNISQAPKGPRVIQNTIVAQAGSGKPAFSAAGFDTTCVVANNIFVGTPAVDLPQGGDANPPSFISNLFYAPSGDLVTGIAPHVAEFTGNVIGQPRFLAADYGDFQLQAGSPGIDQGADGQMVTTTDFNGVNRLLEGDGDAATHVDMGAFEFFFGPARPPAASFQATPYPDRIDFQWAGADGATNYFISRATNPAGPFSDIVATQNLTASDVTAVPNTVYYYSIAGENSRGRGPASPPIVIKAGNHPPVAADDLIDALEDTAIDFSVTGNDADADFDPLAVRLLTPLPGLSLAASNTFHYLPPNNFAGDVTFQYEIADLRSGYSTGSVTIRVQAVNDAPVVLFLPATIPANTPASLGVRITDPDSTDFTVSFITLPQHGLVTASGTNIVYRPARAYFGTDSFSVTISDGLASSAAANCSIAILRPRDVDADQMADDWENFWDLNNPLGDPDGDGFSSLFEYLADTSPRDPASNLRLSKIEKTLDGYFLLEWPAVGGVRYRIWSADQLTGPNVRANFSQLVLSAGNEIETADYDVVVTRTFVDTRQLPATGQRFYFLEVVR